MIPGENALIPGKSIEGCEASWEVLPWGGPSGVACGACMMGSFTGVCYDHSSLHFCTYSIARSGIGLTRLAGEAGETWAQARFARLGVAFLL